MSRFLIVASCSCARSFLSELALDRKEPSFELSESRAFEIPSSFWLLKRCISSLSWSRKSKFVF